MRRSRPVPNRAQGYTRMPRSNKMEQKWAEDGKGEGAATCPAPCAFWRARASHGWSTSRRNENARPSISKCVDESTITPAAAMIYQECSHTHKGNIPILPTGKITVSDTLLLLATHGHGNCGFRAFHWSLGVQLAAYASTTELKRSTSHDRH